MPGLAVGPRRRQVHHLKRDAHHREAAMTPAEFEHELMRFLLPLRGDKPIDVASYDRFHDFFLNCTGYLTKDGLMEVDLAMLLIDMYPTMIGLAAGRQGDERQMIEDWAMELSLLTAEVLKQG